MGFTTYKNVANPHVTIHCDGCRQIKKKGGIQKYNQGEYKHYSSYAEAKAYAESTALKIINCSFCNPRCKAEELQL